MAIANGTATQVTLSGRELALMRRKAMAMHGKTGLAKSAKVSRPASQTVYRPAMAATEPVRTAPLPAVKEVVHVATDPMKNAARARRQALSQSGKAALPAKNASGQSSRGPASSYGSASASASASAYAQSSAQTYYTPGGSSGRQVAMQRRMARALNGRETSMSASSLASRPTGRVRPSQEAGSAAKSVATSVAKSVATSVATSVGSSAASLSWGSQRTAAKAVSGASGQSTQKVTGTEAGSYRHITGTEFMSSQNSQAGNSKAAASSPRQVSVMSAQAGQNASRSVSVTGDEFGAARKLTGTQYMNVSEVNGSAPVAVSTKAPTKVAQISTLAGSSVTGTDLARSSKVTGGEKGGCRPITGTEYIGTQQLQTVCATPESVSPVAKVAQDQTWRGQSITGSSVGRSGKVTGDEPGGCAPISGTPYIGRSQYKAFCEDPQLQAQQTRLRSEAVISAAAVTGDRPGAGGSVMTGDERGACELVTGSPYIGTDNMPTNCAPGSSSRFVQRSVQRSAQREPMQLIAAPKDFSIKSPSMQAKERSSVDAVTGTDFSTQRITGPVNKADGLITGTPEFRHSEPATFAAKQMAAQMTAQPSAAERLTGEGSQSGTRVSGDAWQSSGRVTGTEGTSSLARNLSQRGQPRGVVMNAQQFRDVERAAPPESRITGSSGSTNKGAAVTLSGGARG